MRRFKGWLGQAEAIVAGAFALTPATTARRLKNLQNRGQSPAHDPRSSLTTDALCYSGGRIFDLPEATHRQRKKTG